MKPEIEKLVEKWIKEEREARLEAGNLKELNLWTESINYANAADLLTLKRRELQKSAGLEVVP